ncbi:MAG: DEAD/DEAH box helicase, partial [Acholeplasmataceae bacterium]|nr:DEAD/DEAH box helicase [Acholeplasmataceae bacterium]
MEVKLDQVKGIGPQTLRILRNKGIWNTYDLVLNTPKAYEDFSFTSLYDLKDKDLVTIQGKIITPIKVNKYTKAEVTSFKLSFMNQEISIVSFNKGYLAKTFQQNDVVVVKGVYQLFKHQIVASTIIKPEKKVDIKPIYRIEDLHDANISSIIKHIFEEKQVQIFENIPKTYIERYHLVSRQDAFYKLHFPKDEQDIQQAKRRLKYEEAFFLHLKLSLRQPSLYKRPPKAYDIHKVRDFISKIPYELTQDQKDAVNQIYLDFKKPYASYRLIQGDVGSGKTIVSMIASYAIITAGEQVALMAPTEMLAQQHYQSFKTLMKDVNIALLTSKTKQKDELKNAIKNHEYDIVIGTQALIESDVTFDHLGLIIIDEQHKFGVHTRDELIAKANAKDILYLTATPIPRTLAMAAFGEQHVSLIKQKPKERGHVETIYMTKDKVKDMYEAIRQTTNNKEHVFVVVPAITSDKVDDNIESAYQELKERLNAPIFTLHSKLPKDIQESMMHQFTFTPGSILLSTTMIEVGIDI